MARVSLSKIREFVAVDLPGPVWVGVDVHKKSYHVAVLRSDGQIKTWSAPAEPKLMRKQLKSWEVEIGCLAYEAGPTGFSLARVLQEAGINVIVAAPSRIPRPVTPGNKTDRLDCMALAEYASKGMLKPIAMPSKEQEARRSLGRRRDQISRQVRRCKQRIKSFLLYHDISEPAGLANWSRKGLDALESMKLPYALRYTLDSHILELEHHLTSRQVVDLQLRELLDQQEDDRKSLACMQSTPGVGFVTAAKFRLEIFDPQRFNRAEELTSLVGLAPTVRKTGQQKGQAKIRPAGKKELRSLLVEAAWRWRNKEPWAKRQYDKILAKTGIPQKAIVALARKLCIILWRICMELRPYRPANAA